MAKKNAKNDERRARVEQMRRDQARKERTRSFAILGACVVVVVGLLAAALVPYIKDQRAKAKIEGTPLSAMGVSESAASCSPEQVKDASGSGQHVTPGTAIPYTDAPPSFGKHWGNYLQGSEIRSFYTASDRPELERLVHSLEHGYSLLWYDDTVKSGSADYKAIQQIAQRYGDGGAFMAAPWLSSDEDGTSFPDGKHVALTHWTGPDDQKGVTVYCGKVSGKVVEDFVKKYPRSNAPEPNAV